MYVPQRILIVHSEDPVGKEYSVFGWYAHQEHVSVRSIGLVGNDSLVGSSYKRVEVVPVNIEHAQRRIERPEPNKVA